jgi:PAS domain S-box-containing protein
MFHFIRTLRQRELLTPTAFILAFLLILSFIIILGQFFHTTLQNEMAEQFNKQQLLLAREVAINVEGFIDHVSDNLTVISQLPEIQKIQESPRSRAVAEAITVQIQDETLVTVRVLDRQGVVLYDSAYPGREGTDLSRTDYFRKARGLRRHEKLVTELLASPDQKPEAKQFIVATPIHQNLRNPRLYEFNGVVLAVLSIDGITQKYLSPVKSGTRGYAWMMDNAGTLLYHPTQPQMVGKNLYHTDRTCFKCHKSFDMEKKMTEGKAETFGYYEAPGGENKLAAFYKIPIGSKSWLVVVSAPYSDVIALMRKSRIFYSLLIVSIFITTLVASGVSIFTYKKQIKAEEKAKHLENQQRLEREILLAKNYLENIIESTKTNLMVLDRQFMVKTVNTAQATTLGRPKQDILGRPFFGLFPENLRPYNGIPIESLFQIKEYKITGIEPEPIYLDMNVSPLRVEGEVVGIIITSSNVTKRVLLEEAIKKYTVELEDKVDKGAATAKKLEQQVLHSEKLAALGRLAAGVAHEIGNPLTSISTFAQILREMATDEFAQSSLDIINNHIRRITEIVRQMSTFSRPDSSNIKLHQVNDILKSSLDLMRLDKRMKSTIQIETSLDPSIPKTMIDEGQIAQVFINIILNALDAMPDGGKLTAATRTVRDEEGREFIHICLSDTGVGISESDFEKIFDPFYTTKEPGKGTGLGLSVTYNIVKRFRGDIKVQSEIGKGTTFTVILPVQTEQKEEEHAEA